MAPSSGLRTCCPGVAGCRCDRRSSPPIRPPIMLRPSLMQPPRSSAAMRLYAENCALCHGAGGKGDGPAAAGLPVRPADLTAPHLFAHIRQATSSGGSANGRDNGVMPGFAGIMSPDRPVGRDQFRPRPRRRRLGASGRAPRSRRARRSRFPISPSKRTVGSRPWRRAERRAGLAGAVLERRPRRVWRNSPRRGIVWPPRG